jgi:hypothetical protein
MAQMFFEMSPAKLGFELPIERQPPEARPQLARLRRVLDDETVGGVHSS